MIFLPDHNFKQDEKQSECSLGGKKKVWRGYHIAWSDEDALLSFHLIFLLFVWLSGNKTWAIGFGM